MKLITNGRLITRDAEGRGYYEHGAVAYEGAKIAEVGEEAALRAKYPDAEIVDAKGGVIMPAFINAHTHIYSALARGLSIVGNNPTNFYEVLDGTWWAIDRHLMMDGTRASATALYMDSIKQGVTTIFDHHASYGEIPGTLHTIAQESKRLGLRSCLCYEAEGFPAEDVSGATTQAQSESILQPKYLALGLLFGLVLGVLVVLLRYLFSKNIRSEKDLRDLTGLDYIVRLGDDPQNAALLAIYLQVQCEKSGLHQVTLLAARDLLPKGQQAVQALMETLGQSGLETAFCTLDTQDPAMLKHILSSRCVVPVAEIDRTDCASVQQEMNMCRRDEIPVPAGIVL